MIVLFGCLLVVGALAPAALMVELRDKSGSDATRCAFLVGWIAFLVGWIALTVAACLAAGGAL